MYKIPIKKYNDNIEYFASLLNLGEVMQKPVRQLSLGEKMKCELVCAMLHEPPLVYLDEPTIGLDIISKDTIRNFIKKVNIERQTTFIITTHDLNDIENLCQNITIINHGKIVYNDSLQKLKSHFSNSKIVEIRFSEPVNREYLKDFNVVLYEPLTAKLEIEMTDTDIQSEIFKIFNTLPVQDIDMHNIDIETVIKQIYGGSGL